MKKPKIYVDEKPISKKSLEKYMSEFERNLPIDYQSFLLKNNGGPIFHTSKSNTMDFYIDRFLSLGDLILQEKTGCAFNDWESMETDEYLPDNHNFKELLPIASNVHGSLMLSLKTESYGKVYYSIYSGGEGVYSSNFNSFRELLDNYRIPKDEKIDTQNQVYFPNCKLFEKKFFVNYEKPDLGLERFKELYKDLENPNFKKPEPFRTSLIQSYLDWKPIFDF